MPSGEGLGVNNLLTTTMGAKKMTTSVASAALAGRHGTCGRAWPCAGGRGRAWADVGERGDAGHCRISAIESTSRCVGEGNGALSNGPRVSEAVVVSDHVRLC
jgi:hypothetical protein